MFVRNETFYSFTRNYPVITVLLATHLGLFLLVSLGQWGIFPPGLWIEYYFIGYNFLIAQGEWWRLLTPIVLHLGLQHVLFNSFALFLFGPALEQMLGKVKFISIYFLTAVIANIATFLLQGLQYSHVGASGAIYGLLGLYLYMIIFRKELLDPQSRQVVTIILIIGIVMTFLVPGINVLAHLIGALSGVVLAPLFLQNVRPFIPIQRVPPPKDDGSPQFNPNRWKNKRRVGPGKNGSFIANALGVIFIVLVIVGILANLFI
ncbi:rhomboid family intramembrane serine protease [Natribacillus halophilus]|uniref:Membrane associated serine protease, rhomboid family n=1 Tax=Natribacillus halophilus TaxID=549003 RepID=A0A1G8QIR0_9BACI|nr:rhomboid family intramembrane serine protease [Natribacillus halophilus]SDJ04548.1 Membrane associated serine protease, rhomboid family [Natribacillus halophilus]